MNIPKWRGGVFHLGTKTLRILWFRVSLLALTVGILGATLMSSDPEHKRVQGSKTIVQVETARAGEAFKPKIEESITTSEVETDIEAQSVVEDREEAETPPQNFLFHKVGNGESLAAISRRYYATHTRWREILKANPKLKDPRYLRVGMTLKIPLDFDRTSELKVR